MTKYRESKAPITTTTYDKNLVEGETDNIYEALSIISKRAMQINLDIKKELHEKLEEFATHNDSLEEIFENKEQIEQHDRQRQNHHRDDSKDADRHQCPSHLGSRVLAQCCDHSSDLCV